MGIAGFEVAGKGNNKTVIAVNPVLNPVTGLPEKGTFQEIFLVHFFAVD